MYPCRLRFIHGAAAWREETNGTRAEGEGERELVGGMELMNFPPLVFVMRTHPDGPPLLSPLAVTLRLLIGATAL